MPTKTASETSQINENAMQAMTQLQEAGLGNMVALSTAWVDALTTMGAEVVSFVADRIQEDAKTQHEIMHCRNVADLQHIQAQFVQKALDQYQAETGKLVEMSSKMFQTQNGATRK